jgi:hypothetical protein
MKVSRFLGFNLLFLFVAFNSSAYALTRITVTIDPASAVAAGAQYRLNGGVWKDSGKTYFVAPGTKKIEFKDIGNGTYWIPPDSRAIKVPINQHTALDEDYSYPSFNVANPGKGCPMAHCDKQMSDNINMRIPASVAPDNDDAFRHFDGLWGAAWGLGCVSNGDIAACGVSRKLLGKNNCIRVYNHSGDEIYTSGNLLNWVWTSAPIIDEYGSVIAAGRERMIRFDPEGNIVWDLSLPKPKVGEQKIKYTLGGNYGIIDGGLSMGMVVAGNYIILPRVAGPLTIIDKESGAIVNQKYIYEDSSSGFSLVEELASYNNPFYTTKNSPAVLSFLNKARIYLSCAEVNPDGTGLPFPEAGTPDGAAMVAIDLMLTGKNAGELKPVWNHKYLKPSGASPTLIKFVAEPETGGHQEYGLYFDGNLWHDHDQDPLTDNAIRPGIFGIKVTGYEDNSQYNASYPITEITTPPWVPEIFTNRNDQYIVASFAQNPGGGFWAWTLTENDIYLYDTDHFENSCHGSGCELKRKIIQIDDPQNPGNMTDMEVKINIDSVTGGNLLDDEHHIVGGPTPIATYDGINHAMIVPAAWFALNPLLEGYQYLLAIDISNLGALMTEPDKTLLWHFNLGEGAIVRNTQGQFAVTDPYQNDPHLFFATAANGIYILEEK